MTALKRCDTASSARKSADRQFLHPHISSAGLRCTNGAPVVNIRWLNGIEVPGIPIQRDAFVESSITNLIATATVLHDGAERMHDVSLCALAALGW